MQTSSLQFGAGLQESQNSVAATATNAMASAAKSGDHAKMEEAAKGFESFLYGFMFKSMYSSVQKSEFTESSMGNEIFMQMFIDEAAKNQTMAGSNSLSSQLMKQYEANMPKAEREALRGSKDAAANTPFKVDDYIKDVQSRPSQESEVAVKDDVARYVANLSESVTSHFGERRHPISGKVRHHDGMDFGLSHGTDLHCPAAGKVAFAGVLGGYGNAVIIDHGQGWMTKYGHLSEITVKPGDKINKNDLLGKVGSTGVSTGPHLHLEVLRDGVPVDPRSLNTERNP